MNSRSGQVETLTLQVMLEVITAFGFDLQALINREVPKNCTYNKIVSRKLETSLYQCHSQDHQRKQKNHHQQRRLILHHNRTSIVHEEPPVIYLKYMTLPQSGHNT